MSLRELKEMWYRMWFTPQSPAPLCLFRILLGSMIFLSSIMWLPDLYTWFGYKGIVSIQTMEQFQASNRFSILFWLPPDDRFVMGLFIVFLIATLSFTLGFRSKFSALMVFLCLTSFHHRNLLIFNSGHTLMRVCAFLMIFGPIGKMYSIDSWLAARKAKRTEEIKCSPWVQYLLRFQVAIVYANSSWAKMDGDTWWTGTAVYYASHMQDFYKFPVPVIFDHVLGYQLATWATLAIEFALWTLIWVREFRYYVIALGVVLHLGIDWTMNLPFFEYLMIASYTLFLKPEDVELFIQFLTQPFRAKTSDAIAHPESSVQNEAESLPSTGS